MSMNIFNINKLGVEDVLSFNLKLVEKIWKNFPISQNLFLTKPYPDCGLIDF